MAGITPAEPPVGAVITRWPRPFSSDAAIANADKAAMPRSDSYLSSMARLYTVAALLCSLIGPGSTSSSGIDSPDFTVATMALMILSTKALTSASDLPAIDISLASMILAIVVLLSSAWVLSSFIVPTAYFGGFVLGGVSPFHSMNPPPTE